MINHARTLLLNVAGRTSSREDAGEEYIPPLFSPVWLSSGLLAVNRALFGTAPDRYFLNFRARELLQQIHRTELEEYVYALDPRVTYWPEQAAPLFEGSSKISIARVSGPGVSRLSVQGQAIANNNRGRAWREYDVATTDYDVTISLRKVRGDDTETVTAALNAVDGLSQVLAFPRSNLTLSVAQPVAGENWRVTTVARPAAAVTTLLPILEILGEPVFLELFGLGNTVEPFRTFKNLWFDHPNPVYRLNGLVLGLIYRMEEIRSGVNA